MSVAKALNEYKKAVQQVEFAKRSGRWGDGLVEKYEAKEKVARQVVFQAVRAEKKGA
jgi:hypothetical protein